MYYYVHKVSSVEAVDFHILRISIHIASFPNHAHQHIVNYLSITINIPSTTSLFSTISISSTLRCYQPIMSSTVSASCPITLNFCSFSKSSTPSPFPSAYDQLPLHSHQHIINFVPSMLSSIKSTSYPFISAFISSNPTHSHQQAINSHTILINSPPHICTMVHVPSLYGPSKYFLMSAAN